MAVHSSSVGQQGHPAVDEVEERWLSNYAASIGDSNPCYFENRNRFPAVHPAYVSHLEWAAINFLHGLIDMPEAEVERGIHSFNQTQLLDSFSVGEQIESIATIVGAEQRYSGARLTYRIDTFSERGPVARSYTQTIFREVSLVGPEIIPSIPQTESTRPESYSRTEKIHFGQLAPYVFSECARDYGPIHTSCKAAHEAGIPGLIFHGTGLIASAISSIVNSEANGDPTRVTGFSARLSAMVLCPSTATLQCSESAECVRFSMFNEEGKPALKDGFVWLS